MAFSRIIRKSSSTIAPLAARVIGGQSFRQTAAVFSVLNRRTHSPSRWPTSTYFSSRRYSTDRRSSDESLLRIIESEIKCAEESDQHEGEVPDGFPFKIEDNPGQQTITLTREYQGETILVEVSMPDLVTGEDDDDNAADDEERAVQSSIPLVVNISKKDRPSLEFGCTAFPDEITIDSLSLKNPEISDDQIAYEGPDFSDLDENLQKAFHKYLEIRGIKPSATNFLHEYMINKDSKEYLMWLNNVKKFVEA
ncbi:hypothetical protein Ancab_034383 [Ancistrocladus abbreviatus]